MVDVAHFICLLLRTDQRVHDKRIWKVQGTHAVVAPVAAEIDYTQSLQSAIGNLACANHSQKSPF